MGFALVSEKHGEILRWQSTTMHPLAVFPIFCRCMRMREMRLSAGMVLNLVMIGRADSNPIPLTLSM